MGIIKWKINAKRVKINKVFSEFRLHEIPYVFFYSVYFVKYIYGIALNSTEFCITAFVEFHGISGNSATFGVTKFRKILISGG
jgi:hypothetical protein